MSRKFPRNVIVIGLGTFGTTVATELMRFGNYMLWIYRDEAFVNWMADTLSQTVIASRRDEDAFKDLGLNACDVAVIAIGENLEGSVVTALSLKLTGVPQV